MSKELTYKDILEVSELIKEDYIVPISVAAKLKGISDRSIWNAINRGELRSVRGVTLSSLDKLKVSKRTNSGKVSALAKMLKAKEAIKVADNIKEAPMDSFPSLGGIDDADI